MLSVVACQQDGARANADDFNNAYPMLWESSRPEGKQWSTIAMQVIQTEAANDLMRGADDIASFCPRYDSLNNTERANFWGLLVSAIVKHESDFDPLSRMAEPSLGIDPVTKQTVHSEGLMQMSYGDRSMSSACEFDWATDRSLPPKDPRKSILSPERNLRCGINILAQQIRKYGKISIKSGAYWSVLIPNGAHSEVKNIQAVTMTMPGCS